MTGVSTLVLHSGVMNILRMSVTSCSAERFLEILLDEQIFSPTFQCGSYFYLLQMSVHMHINTAVWVSAHVVSLHEHRQAYNMGVCILIFTLMPTKCDRQWNQKIFIKSADEKNDTIIHAFPIASSRCKRLLSLMSSSVAQHLPYVGISTATGLHLQEGLGLASQTVSKLSCSPLPLYVFKTSPKWED